MDPDVARWSLEFLIRSSTRVTGTLIKKIIRTSTIPLSNTDSRFKKTLLLRTLQDDLSTASIAETMLETLEVLEELCRRDGSPITAAMSAAYCAVAVECTLKYLEVSLHNNPAYLKAVERIWRGRVRYMEPSASGDGGSLLFSAELNRWRGDIEASLLDSQVMERLAGMNTRRDAINKLKVYLAEAWADMGPSFLELAASLPTNKGFKRLIGNLVDDERTWEVPAAGTGVCDLVSDAQPEPEPTSGDEGTDTRGACIGSGTHTTELDGSGSPAQEERVETHKDNQLLERKCTTNTGGEEVDPSTTCRKIDSVRSVEVQKVRESLKCSSLELQTLVKDPLPDALHISDIIRSELAKKDMNQEPPIENQSIDAEVPEPHVVQRVNNNDANINKTSSVRQSDVHHPSMNQEPPIEHQSRDADVPDPHVGQLVNNNDANLNKTSSHHPSMNQESPIEHQAGDADVPDPHVGQGVNNNDANLNKTSSVRQNDVHPPSLMQRNSTACTYEWDDSIDGLQGGTSNHASRFHLPSPKRKNVSPLKAYEPGNVSKRRKPKKWSELEEETLRTAVNKIGKGNWKLILNSHRDIFQERTEVDLKDKWRNMTRYGGKGII